MALSWSKTVVGDTVEVRVYNDNRLLILAQAIVYPVTPEVPQDGYRVIANAYGPAHILQPANAGPLPDEVPWAENEYHFRPTTVYNNKVQALQAAKTFFVSQVKPWINGRVAHHGSVDIQV